MLNAIRAWTISIDDYPGWREWRRNRIGHTLHFDDQFPTSLDKPVDDFRFSDEIERQHAVVLQYLGMQETINLTKECEYYFRRYPFRGLPVTRYNHITNICEMYFGRFYELKERLKNYFKAVEVVAPNHRINIGRTIRAFEKVYDHELRARNSVHHHRRFEDVAIDRVFLTESVSATDAEKRWKREHLVAYRKVAKEWAERVRRRGAELDEFLEAIASETLTNCEFLSVLALTHPQPFATQKPGRIGSWR